MIKDLIGTYFGEALATCPSAGVVLGVLAALAEKNPRWRSKVISAYNFNVME